MNKVPNNKLKEARLRRNWSQEMVANRLGIDRKTYNRWENGKTEPQLALRQKLCSLFKMTGEELGFTRFAVEEAPVIPDEKLKLTHPRTGLTIGLEEVAAVFATLGEMSMAQFDPSKRKTLEVLVATIQAAALFPFQATARLSPFQKATMHPVAIGIPLRYSTDRGRLLIAAEDAKTSERLDRLLKSRAFATSRFQIEPTATNPPSGDAIVICGPKSAPVAERLLDHDPVLRFVEDGGRWFIEKRHDGTRYGSPTDANPPQMKDIAYIACHRDKDRVLIHIAGIHSIGSLGAAYYLNDNLVPLFTEYHDVSCSFLVEADYNELEIVSAKLLDGPYQW